MYACQYTFMHNDVIKNDRSLLTLTVLVLFICFTEAFTNLKKSEFYEEPVAEVKAAGEPKQKVLNKPASKNSVVVNPKQVSL